LYSPVLRAAFNSNLVEGQTQTYILEDFTTRAFQLVVQWLYRQLITPPVTREESSLCRAKGRLPLTPQDYDITRKIDYRSYDLISVWLIADYLQIPRLQNYVVDQMDQLRLHFQTIPVRWISVLYDDVPRGAAIRELAFEQCVRFIPDRWYEKYTELFPKQYLLDHVIWYKRSLHNKSQPNPFKDRAEFKRRFHVPEERNDSLWKETA
jgi:hypothetical protein